MLDISNKLHAMVDKFVSSLSSECGTLANNMSGEAPPYVADVLAPADPSSQRPSNRTTSEVLNGLKRPSITTLTNFHHREGVQNVQQANSNTQAGQSKNREDLRTGRYMKDMKAKGAALQVLEKINQSKPLHTDFEDILSRDEENRGGSTTRMAAKGRLNHAVEVLSSDSTSSDCPRPRAKHGPRSLGTQLSTKGRASTSHGRSRRKMTRSPSMSPESSHLMDYSYEEDTPSIGGKSPCGDTTFDIELTNEDGGPKKTLDNTDVHCDTENQNMHEGKNDDVDVNLEEYDESNGEDTGRDPIPAESESEELPVLPRVPVKRKAQNEPRVSERKTQRGRPKSGTPQTKKQRRPQIDASVITQLEFGRRPHNCVSLPTSWLLIFFHSIIDLCKFYQSLHPHYTQGILCNLNVFLHLLCCRVQSE